MLVQLSRCAIILSCWLRISGGDTSSCIRSASPEFDEVAVSENSEEEDDDDEYSEVIPVRDERPKFFGDDSSDEHCVAAVFDYSDSDEFSLPQVDWSSINSLSPKEAAVNVLEEGDQAGESAELKETGSGDGEVLDSATASNIQNADNEFPHEAEVCEADTDMSTSNGFDHRGAETVLLREWTETAGDSPTCAASRLSRKRTRVTKDGSEECKLVKRLHRTVDDTSGTVVPRFPPLVSDGSALPSCYDTLLADGREESTSALQHTVRPVITTFVSGSAPDTFLQEDSDVSFSQGILYLEFKMKTLKMMLNVI